MVGGGGCNFGCTEDNPGTEREGVSYVVPNAASVPSSVLEKGKIKEDEQATQLVGHDIPGLTGPLEKKSPKLLHSQRGNVKSRGI